MKKYYPEEYFRRSGYAFGKDKKKDMVYFNANKKKMDQEFSRFNEELVYPKTESKVDAKS